MSEDVRGWCLGRNNLGMPVLSECALMAGVQGRYYSVLIDSEGNPITVRSYQRGETFFTNHRQALEVLVEELDALKIQHQGVLSYIATQRYKAEQELEKENGDVPSR